MERRLYRSVNLVHMLDFHNHLMPGIDDGAADLDESRYGLSMLAAQGADTVITTPHLMGSWTQDEARLSAYMERVDEAWRALSDLAKREFPQLDVKRGSEVMLDVPSVSLTDSRVRLAATSFVLVEFPYMNIPPRSASAISDIKKSGFIPIIAHPERYSNMSVNLALAAEWKESGAFLQVNAGSVVGYYGAKARSIVMGLLSEGYADYLCSDFHSRGKCALADARSKFEAMEGVSQFDVLTSINPGRMLRDELPLPVDPIDPAEASIWKKLLRR